MRPLVFVASIAVLGLGSYWVLTHGFQPGGDAGIVGPQRTEEASDEVVVVRPSASPAGGDEALASAPATRSPRPTVRTEVERVSYVVGGGTPDDILDALVANGPKAEGETFFGITESSVDFLYETVPAQVGCQISNVQVVLHLTITLPEWAAPADAGPDLTRDWGRFRRALADHEDHHREIAEDGANALLDAVFDLHRTTCESVREEARRRLERGEIEIAALHRRYDAETGHGQTEGAVWPLSR